MKIGIVKRGRVGRIWPWTKTLPDGRQVVKELPPQYRLKNGVYPDVIKELPDYVERGWLWDKSKQDYVPPPPKVIPPKIVPHSDLLEVVAERTGLNYDELWADVMARKKARRAKLKGLTPHDKKG